MQYAEEAAQGTCRVGKPKRKPAIQPQAQQAGVSELTLEKVRRIGAKRALPSASGRVCGSTIGTSALGGACIFPSTSSGSVSAHCAGKQRGLGLARYGLVL